MKFQIQNKILKSLEERGGMQLQKYRGSPPWASSLWMWWNWRRTRGTGRSGERVFIAHSSLGFTSQPPLHTPPADACNTHFPCLLRLGGTPWCQLHTRNGKEERMAVFFPLLALAAALPRPINTQIGWEILGANFHLPHREKFLFTPNKTYLSCLPKANINKIRNK